MNLDAKIKEAFARHETDVQPSPGAWSGVEKTIARRHKTRIALTVAGTAMAIAAAIVAIPRLGSNPDATFDSTPAGWQVLRQSGYAVAYPPDWKLVDSSDGFAIIAPSAAKPAEGLRLPAFHITLGLSPEVYTQVPSNVSTADEGSIGGRRYVRYSEPAHTHGIATNYRIEWPRVGACSAAPACTMGLLIDSSTSAVRDRYLATAERIALSATPITTPQAKPSQPRLIRKVPANVFALATGSNSLWGLESNANPVAKQRSLIRLDPSVRKVMARIPVGYVPQEIAADDHAIWVTNGSGCMAIVSCADASSPPEYRFPYQNSVMRIDPRTNKVVASIRVTEPQDVAIGFGSVWVTAKNGTTSTVVRIDPTTNKIVKNIFVGGSGFSSLAAGDRFLWVVNHYKKDGNTEVSEVKRVDPQTNTVAFGPFVDEFEAKIAAGFGATWVTTTGTDSASGIRRIDPASGRVVARITLPDAAPVGLNAVASGEGFIWAASARGYLWKIDPAHNQHSDPVTVVTNPPGPANDVVAAFGFVWVASSDGQIWQLTP